MCGPDPTAGAEATHSFVLWFLGQVLTDCSLPLPAALPIFRALYRSIPLNELIPTLPFLSLADAWLLSYPPFPTSRPFSQATPCIVSLILLPAVYQIGRAMCRDNLNYVAEATHSFVLLFLGQVLTDCRLRFATSMQGLRALHHSIPLDELIPTLPFPSLADAWLLSYPPFPTSRPFSQATPCIVSLILVPAVY